MKQTTIKVTSDISGDEIGLGGNFPIVKEWDSHWNGMETIKNFLDIDMNADEAKMFILCVCKVVPREVLTEILNKAFMDKWHKKKREAEIFDLSR